MLQNLLQSSQSTGLQQDLAWILGAAIKKCAENKEEDSRGALAGLQGCGLQLTEHVLAAFRSLYHVLAGLLRNATAQGDTDAQMVLLNAWSLQFNELDHSFLPDSQIFPVIRRLMATNKAPEAARAPDAKSSCTLTWPQEITSTLEIAVSSSEGRAICLTDKDTDTYWQSGIHDNQIDYGNKPWVAQWLQLAFDESTIVQEVCFHIDAERDRGFVPNEVIVSVGDDADHLTRIAKFNLAEGF
jgi:hypothetical protein